MSFFTTGKTYYLWLCI